MRLIDELKNNDRVYMLNMMMRGLIDQSVAKRIRGINTDPREIVIESKGKNGKGRIYYEININDKHAGFFALMRWVLSALNFADVHGFIPYIYFGDQTKYYDADIIDTNNPYEYYFLQKDCTEEMINSAYSVVRYVPKHLLFSDLKKNFQQDPAVINRFAELWKKYICVNDKTMMYLNNEIVASIAAKPTLGVHIRGTDYKLNYDGHPVAISVHEEISIAKKAIDNYGFEQIFLATDDEEYLRDFIDEFGNQVVYYSDTYRSKDGTAVHDSEDNRQCHYYKLGLEVLKDAYTLAMCDGLIAGQSNVSFFATVINKAEKDGFKFLKICDSGFNKNSKKYEKR